VVFGDEENNILDAEHFLVPTVELCDFLLQQVGLYSQYEFVWAVDRVWSGDLLLTIEFYSRRSWF
jgi:hypothetical protein